MLYLEKYIFNIFFLPLRSKTIHFLGRKGYFPKSVQDFLCYTIKRERLYARRSESIFYATRGIARFAVRHGIIYFSFDRWRPHFLICMQIVTSEVYNYHNFLSFSFSNFFEFLVDRKEKGNISVIVRNSTLPQTPRVPLLRHTYMREREPCYSVLSTRLPTAPPTTRHADGTSQRRPASVHARRQERQQLAATALPNKSVLHTKRLHSY